jgi:caa(3)-type oxidase subunit IV
MSGSTAEASPAPAPASEEHHPSYVKIWAVLLALLVVSVAGPMLEIRVVTLITAFGIAIVKAYIVAKHFMHVNLERRWVAYLLVAMLALMGLFVGGVSPDVMKHDGLGWENTAARSAVEKGLEEGARDGRGAHHE